MNQTSLLNINLNFKDIKSPTAMKKVQMKKNSKQKSKSKSQEE